MSETLTPINLSHVADLAASEFSLSLISDRQIWDDRTITAQDVKVACFEAAQENATTAVYRAVGKLVETLTMALDLEVHENGAMADLDGVLSAHIEGAVVDLSEFADLKDWDAKLEFVRGALAPVAQAGTKIAPLTVAQLLEYANNDPRLHVEGLRKEISALIYDGAADVMAQDAKVVWVDVEIEQENWDDVQTLEPVTPQKVTKIKLRPLDSVLPKLCGMAAIAGIPDADMASVLGISKGYYSFVKSGKRPFPGVRPDRVAALHRELDARLEAINEMKLALDDPAVTNPAEA